MDPLSAGLLLAKFVPDVVKYFKGDAAGAIAEKVVGFAQSVTGTKTPEQAISALELDPEKVMEFQKLVMANQTELERMYLLDVQNARERDVKLAQAGFKNHRANVMLALTYLGLIGCVVIMLVRDIDANTAIGGVLLLLIGKFSNSWDTAFNFEFGTSAGSKAKDKENATLTSRLFNKGRS